MIIYNNDDVSNILVVYYSSIRIDSIYRYYSRNYRQYKREVMHYSHDRCHYTSLDVTLHHYA